MDQDPYGMPASQAAALIYASHPHPDCWVVSLFKPRMKVLLGFKPKASNSDTVSEGKGRGREGWKEAGRFCVTLESLRLDSSHAGPSGTDSKEGRLSKGGGQGTVVPSVCLHTRGSADTYVCVRVNTCIGLYIKVHECCVLLCV